MIPFLTKLLANVLYIRVVNSDNILALAISICENLDTLNDFRETNWEAFRVTFKTGIIKNTTLLSKETNNLFVLCTRQIWKQILINNRAI